RRHTRFSRDWSSDVCSSDLHAFLPTNMQPFAYSDMQVPLTHQQRMLTPLEEATILQALKLTGDEIVLEVGTGTGFMTALLSRLRSEERRVGRGCRCRG